MKHPAARQSLDAQLDSLAEAGVTRVFSEKISTRATRRPELEAAVKLAGEIRSSGVAVTLVVKVVQGARGQPTGLGQCPDLPCLLGCHASNDAS